MLWDDEEQFVELMMDNILWGNVEIIWNEIKEEDDTPQKERISYKIGTYHTLKKSNSDNEQLKSITTDLSMFFTVHRLVGNIKGEVKDRNGQKINNELQNDLNLAEQTIQEITSQLIKTQNENKKLHDENITLANELNDLKNIVNSYETASLKE